MKTRSANLPDFENPPVIEVVLGIQFDRIASFQTIHAGHLWDGFRRDFPQVQEHPPLEPTFETFGTKPVAEGVKLELMSGPLPFPRLWFLNDAQTQLIQFQPDRFIHNWRKVKEGDVYPRYERIKTRFLDELATLEKFFSEHRLGDLRPNQCEITYVNHILSADGENLCEQPESVFRFFRKDFDQSVLEQFEDSRFQIRFVLCDEKKSPIGRLHVNAQPARSRDGQPMIALTLTARAGTSAPTLEAASQFLDFGRDKIVRCFAEITTDIMHDRWGRRQ
jgi:uncharacterized protein (TIGR04255 family)